MTDLADIRLPLRIKRVTSGERMGGCFHIRDAAEQALGYFYFGPPDAVSRSAARLLTEAEAETLAKVAARAITAQARRDAAVDSTPGKPR